MQTHPRRRKKPEWLLLFRSTIDLVKIALGQFDLGPAAAMSLIYFLMVLAMSWVFYTVMTRDEART